MTVNYNRGNFGRELASNSPIITKLGPASNRTTNESTKGIRARRGQDDFSADRKVVSKELKFVHQ